MVDEVLQADDWVRFFTEPFPPDVLSFAREKDLQLFVEACLGYGVFRGLRFYRDQNHRTGREFRLPNGQKIDLLCRERTRSGDESLVAFELKRDDEHGTVGQMIGYLDAFRKFFPPGYPPHVHSSLDVDGQRVHIDYIWANMWGPGRSKSEIHIFVDDCLAGFGGHWGTSLGASSSISPTVALLDDRRALVFDGPSPALQDDSKTACLGPFRVFVYALEEEMDSC